MDAAILRRIVEIQIDQAELLRRYTNAEATRQMGMHLRIAHGGDELRHKLQVEFDRQNDRVSTALDRNREELLDLLAELSKTPAPTAA